MGVAEGGGHSQKVEESNLRIWSGAKGHGEAYQAQMRKRGDHHYLNVEAGRESEREMML